MSERPANAAAADYAGAMHEIESNLGVRRLMFVISNVIVPAFAVAMTDCLTGSTYSDAISWLPLHVITISGLVLAVSGVLITAVLGRCHFGMVVNGTKMKRALRGEFQPEGLNWLGVTTNFTALTALSSGCGLGLFFAGLDLPVLAWISGPILIVVLMLFLQVNHTRANRLCQRLEASWQTGPIEKSLQEQHVRLSLEATSNDVAVIVTMAAALFTGLFNSVTNIGGIPTGLTIHPPAELVRSAGVPWLMGFALVSLLLSGRMVVRLRIALAAHARQLAELREESDDPYRFKVLERTFLLFLLLQLLTGMAATILAWTLTNATVGISVGVGVIAAGLVWYPFQLRRSRPAADAVA